MTFSFLVTAREGLEMALIVAILLGYLRNIHQKEHFKEIWYGVAAAAGLSIAFAGGLELASRELDGRVLEVFEAATMLLAVAVLTWMLFWMKMQSAGISSELKGRIDVALSSGSVLALSLLAFSAVGREGLETALFLFAGSSSQASESAFLLGGVLGFAVAAVAGVILYYGAARLPIKQFFTISGVILIVLAAGLLSNALTALNEAAVLTDLGPRPWDTEGTIAMTSTLGKFAHTLLGYDSAPALSQIIVYWTYLIVVLGLYLFAPVPSQNIDRTRPAAVAAVTQGE